MSPVYMGFLYTGSYLVLPAGGYIYGDDVSIDAIYAPRKLRSSQFKDT